MSNEDGLRRRPRLNHSINVFDELVDLSIRWMYAKHGNSVGLSIKVQEICGGRGASSY